eukprot:scaffold15205_cov128-Cylindrotheca_fusiformis.AAC.4
MANLALLIPATFQANYLSTKLRVIYFITATEVAFLASRSTYTANRRSRFTKSELCPRRLTIGGETHSRHEGVSRQVSKRQAATRAYFFHGPKTGSWVDNISM